MIEIVHLGKHYYPDFGGIETATKDLAEAGVQFGLPVTCYSTAKNAAGGKQYELNGVRVRRQRTWGRLLRTSIAPGMFLIREKGPMLLHVHLPNPLAELSALVQLCWRRKKLRLAPFLHALPFRNRGIGRLWYQLFTRPLLKRADSILISSEHLRQAFPELNEFSDKLKVISFCTSVPPAESCAAWWPLRHMRRQVLALGRLVPYKGYLELVEAWGLIRDLARETHTKLLIVGDGPLRTALQEKIKNLGLEDTVELRESCDEMQKQRLLEESFLFAMPSQTASETFGIAMLEAMAYGLPVLATTLNTGLSLLARGGDCGAAVKPGSVSCLGAALGEMLQAESSRLEKIGAANHRFAEEKFSPVALRGNYQRLLADLYPGFPLL